ncbi:MAG: GNAT family N-acetyltransferase [Acetobacteraceae bacterium]|nr:GNAT family N-acetyltransferase [Acetobacteraceae bacterium]
MADYERLLHRFTATENALAQALFAHCPLAYAVLAEIDEVAVGFAIWTYSFQTFRCDRVLFVEDVFVNETERGHGIGYALFRHLAREAREQGCERMEWRVLDWNEPALRFYDRLGAKPPPAGWVGRELSADALKALAGR